MAKGDAKKASKQAKEAQKTAAAAEATANRVTQAWALTQAQVTKTQNVMATINKQMQDLNAGSTEHSKSLVNLNARHKEMLDTLSKTAGTAKGIGTQAYQMMVDAVDEVSDGQMTLNDLLSKEADLLAEANEAIKQNGAGRAKELMGQRLIYTAEKDRQVTQLKTNEAIAMGDELTGQAVTGAMDWLDTAKKIGPAFLIGLGAITLVWKMMTKANEQVDEIGESFGAIGVQEYSQAIIDSDAEMTKLGHDTGTTAEIAEQLSANYGKSFDESIKLATSIADTSKALGMSNEEMVDFVGTYTTVTGLSEKAAIEMAKQTASLAEANGVAPGVVMKEIAENTEFFAQYAKDGGGNIMKAAIQAKKLGVSLDDVSNITEGLLDFQNSINSEMEASIMIGRDLNFQKARELALNNDIEGAMAEVIGQLGDEEEFNKLNALQRQSLADAIGVSTAELAKFVAAEEEAAEIGGELEKQDVTDIVGKEALGNLSEMINSFKSLFDTLSAEVGPALVSLLENVMPIVEQFALLIGWLNEAGALFPMIAGAIAFMTTKMIANTVATIANSGAKTGNAAAAVTEAGANTAAAGAKTAAAIPVFGWVIGLALMAAIGAAIWAMMAQTKQESSKAKATPTEDAFIPGMDTGGPGVSSPKGTFQGLPEDDVMMGTDLSSGGRGGGGAGMGAVVDAINQVKTQIVNLKAENLLLREDMAAYFGTGGTMKKAVTRSGEVTTKLVEGI